MPKLHEILAVEQSLENQANKVRSDLTNTFSSKRHLFEETRTVFSPLAEGSVETIEQVSDIQSSVQKELNWIVPHLAKSLDASYHVAETNTQARADVVLENGDVLLKNIPATALLELEKRMTEIHNLIDAIPTLDPAKGFTLDTNRGIYQAREVTKTRTKKTKTVVVLYPATDKHPAQTQLVDEDVPTGKIREQAWSGLITPSEKSELVNKVEVLQRAIRQARSRANDASVDTSAKIGRTLLDFVFSK